MRKMRTPEIIRKNRSGFFGHPVLGVCLEHELSYEANEKIFAHEIGGIEWIETFL